MKISTKIVTSIYNQESEYLTITIEGQPIDEYFDSKEPSSGIRGRVLTLDSLSDPKERKVVWDRICPNEGSIKVAPILTCPDDLDLSCSVIVAQIETKGDKIIWHRVGEDKTEWSRDFPEDIGSEVDWFDKIEKMEFDKNEYLKVLSEFKEIK